jgi:ABC-2 type transport system permease protein
VIRLARSVQRILAIVGKELIEIVRRPGAVVSLVFGPLLILALFGFGYDGTRRPLDTIVVVPPSAGLPVDLKSYQDLAGGGLRILEVTPDRASAQAALAAQTVDVVISVPEGAADRFRAGEQSVITVEVDLVDPIQENYAGFLASNLSSAVNREIIRQAAAEGQDLATTTEPSRANAIPPEVIAAPTRAEVVNIAPSAPSVVAFYGPAVLALILQHLAASLIALSLVRERTSGMMELFRIAPVGASELLAGKVVSYGLISGGIAALTVALLTTALHVPILADPGVIAGVIALLVAASLGLGLLIAVVSDSERQAVQLSLLLLLASVFFSGLVVAIEEFAAPVRILAYALPVTHGIRLISDLMLRGGTTVPWEAGILGVIALATILVAWIRLRRSMRRA